MIFRVENNLLYEIPGIENEEAFLKAQEGGKIEFIRADEEELPKKENVRKIFYKLEKNSIVIDEDRTAEFNINELKKQIEQRATSFVKKQLDELDYDNEGEVALYAGNEKSGWNAEAKALQFWIEEVYKKMYELEDSVTADNYETIDLDKIEAEYPKFEFKEEK